MVTLCNLLVKYSHFSRVDDDVFLYIDHILKNAYEIYTQQQKVKNEIEILNKQLEKRRQTAMYTSQYGPAKTTAKKRKVRSIDASFPERKENKSIIEDSLIFPCKSDPESSTTVTCLLEQNILDSEESFFALTQSPPRREVISARNASDTYAELSHVQSPQLSIPTITQPVSRACHMSDDDLASLSGSKNVQKSGSSTPSVAHTKRTANKQIEQNATPPLHTLVAGSNRLRQTKLKFPLPNNASTKAIKAESTANDTIFSDFIVLTPPSTTAGNRVNKSKFLRSLRMKKQSTMIDTVHKDHPLNKRSTTVIALASKENMVPLSPDDDYDIDQTFCPGAESLNPLHRDVRLKLKQELLSQDRTVNSLNVPSKATDSAPSMFDINSNDADSSGVMIVAPDENTIISIAESQPPDDALYMAFSNDCRNLNNHAESNDLAMARTKTKQNNKPTVLSSLGHTEKPKFPSYSRIPQGLCTDCLKLYHFHTSCGISDDTARTKLPRNCRSCRLAQLHSTPPGFWDPDFLPTQQ